MNTLSRIYMRTLAAAAVPALALALTGCPRPYPPTQPQVQARLGEEVALAPGQTAAVEGERITVTFLRVTEDSRCPQGVQCVHAGEAKVELELHVDSGAEGARARADARVVLSTPIEPRSATLGAYRVHLVRLDPLPTQAGPPERYTATLRIEKP